MQWKSLFKLFLSHELNKPNFLQILKYKTSIKYLKLNIEKKNHSSQIKTLRYQPNN